MISVFAPNLEKRADRRRALQAQFAGKKEFQLNIVPAITHPHRGAWGLWQTFIKIIVQQKALQRPFFIFCEDDHTFTEHYSYERLRSAISKAEALEADVLSGGVSWFRDAIQCDSNLFWIDRFNGMQFTVIFSRFYDRILEANQAEGYVTDIRLSELSDRIFMMFPFISVQSEFGYSDVTFSNNKEGYVNSLFERSALQFSVMDKVKQRYENMNK